jgi:LuxR family transcriptional regulator
MDSLQEVQLQSALRAKSTDELFASILKVANELEFDHCAYGIRVPLPITAPKIQLINNYPESWQKRYEEQNYLAFDPTVAHALRSTSAMIWADKTSSSCSPFWEDAHSHGLQVGLAQPCHSDYGVAGLLTLARSHNNISYNELFEHSSKIYWMAQIAHQGMASLLVPQMMPEIKVELSIREIEVLRWTSDGKTSAEISDLMNISERTVNFHIGNAARKLNSKNKVAAAVKAIMLGLL